MDPLKKMARNVWVDYLRSTITVLVVAHHASLAYTSFAAFDKTAYINSTAPVVDSARWVGMDIFENFNDIFFMFLMFFIGGLFIAKSIDKKRSGVFIKDRFYRLFIPFLLGGTLLMLLAYYPSFMLAYSTTDIAFYFIDFFTTQQWPVGPPWFIWVLFAFNLLVALLYPLTTNFITKAANNIAGLANKPLMFFLLVFTMTWLLYVPVAYNLGAGTWTGFGPFDFQLSRVLTYFGYFMLGVIVGATDFNSGLFGCDKTIITRWKLWILLSLIIYIAITINSMFKILENLVMGAHLSASAAWLIYYSIYAASCTASCIAFISLFRARVLTERSWWRSLSDNAYLIYLVHYVFITWIQFFLLDIPIPAFLKFIIVFVVTFFASWLTSSLLRKAPFIRRYL